MVRRDKSRQNISVTQQNSDGPEIFGAYKKWICGRGDKPFFYKDELFFSPTRAGSIVFVIVGLAFIAIMFFFYQSGLRSQEHAPSFIMQLLVSIFGIVGVGVTVLSPFLFTRNNNYLRITPEGFERKVLFLQVAFPWSAITDVRIEPGRTRHERARWYVKIRYKHQGQTDSAAAEEKLFSISSNQVYFYNQDEARAFVQMLEDFYRNKVKHHYGHADIPYFRAALHERADGDPDRK
jgi:hypothetical protein